MYSIENSDGCRLVRFESNFNCSIIKLIVHHETQFPDYYRTNDIWLIGEHRSLISISDIDSIVFDFKCRCPKNAFRRKTAVVVAPGLTEAVVGILIDEISRKIPFEIRIFNAIEDAYIWFESAEAEVV